MESPLSLLTSTHDSTLHPPLQWPSQQVTPCEKVPWWFPELWHFTQDRAVRRQQCQELCTCTHGHQCGCQVGSVQCKASNHCSTTEKQACGTKQWQLLTPSRTRGNCDCLPVEWSWWTKAGLQQPSCVGHLHPPAVSTQQCKVVWHTGQWGRNSGPQSTDLACAKMGLKIYHSIPSYRRECEITYCLSLHSNQDCRVLCFFVCFSTLNKKAWWRSSV